MTRKMMYEKPLTRKRDGSFERWLGGAVAVNINCGTAKLVLLCPARKNWVTAKTVRPDTVILHSRANDVIPFADSEELASKSGATLIEVGNDHRLADLEPLAAMLKECERHLSVKSTSI
ncbi:MAG: hypothetical protein ACO3GX_10505 [Gemmataceae bacterium]